MDKIINILLLIIIFVFDPLAISLVVAANFAFDKAYPKKKYRKNLYEEEVEVKDEPNVFDEYSEEDEKRMDVIAQNGNDGLHYEEVAKKMDEDGISLTSKDGKTRDVNKYLQKIKEEDTKRYM